MQNITHRPTIDFHAHVLEDEVLRRSPWCWDLDQSTWWPRAANASTFQEMLDPQSQIEEMERRGIDINLQRLSFKVPRGQKHK
jgi:hypothetical protein